MNDLQPERDLIEELVIKHGCLPVRAEGFHDSFNSPEKVIENKIRECRGYIGLFDKIYGTSIPTKNNPHGYSVTHMELHAAKKLDLAIRVFVSEREDIEREKPLQDLLKQLFHYHDGRWIKSYNNLEELRHKLDESLPSFLEDMNNLGFNPDIAEGIIVNPLDLSLTLEDSIWRVNEKNNQFQLMTSPEFDEVSNKVFELIGRNKSVIVTGKHGIGKSTFIRLLIAKNIEKLPAIINYSKIKGRVNEDILESFSKKNLYVLFDPIEPLAYTPRAEISRNIFNASEDITSTVKDFLANKINFILVVSEDVWNRTEKKISNKDYDIINLNGVFRRENLIKAIITSYSKGKNLNNVEELSTKIFRFNDAYLLLAAYVGRALEKVQKKTVSISYFNGLFKV